MVSTEKRPYDRTLRQRQAALTREQIVIAGSELLHDASVRDWKRLTVQAIAQRAGVSERTIYRHFGNEQGLHDAVMHRLEEESGIVLEGMRLEDVSKVAVQIFEHVSRYPTEPRAPLDPTLVDANRRQKEALRNAIAARTKDWSEDEQVLAAAVLDVLWSVATYERLAVDWQIDHEQALDGGSWVIGLVERAILENRGPFDVKLD